MERGPPSGEGLLSSPRRGNNLSWCRSAVELSFRHWRSVLVCRLRWWVVLRELFSFISSPPDNVFRNAKNAENPFRHRAQRRGSDGGIFDGTLDIEAGDQERIFDGRDTSTEQRDIVDRRVDSGERTDRKDKLNFVVRYIDLATARHAQIIAIDNQVLR